MSDCRFGVSPVNYPDPDLSVTTPGRQRTTEDVQDNILVKKEYER